METKDKHVKERLPFTLRRFHVSEDYGFLSPNPLTELPLFYSPWMEIAHRLPDLIETHQLRSHVDKMPLLSTQHLQGDRELQLAHLALSFVTMGYVWQEGEKGTVKVLPRNLAIPFAEISRTLGLPPILVHMDFVLVNWKKKDHNGPLEIENLDPVICLPGGESLRGFILVTFLVEKAAAPGIKAIAQAVNGIHQNDGKILEEALQEISSALKDMMAALKTMHDYVDPEIFYRVIRIFLSGWQDNPALSGGLIYEGVWEEPRAYSGGSAAQSTTLHAFDELLGIRHSRECTAFLHRMRDYMPPHHQAFIKEIQASPLLRCYVLSSGKKELQSGYNRCVAALSDLRTCHIAIVTKYITMAAIHARAKPSNATPRMSPPSFLEKRGTGGSEVLSFLKSIRDTTREAMLDF